MCSCAPVEHSLIAIQPGSLTRAHGKIYRPFNSPVYNGAYPAQTMASPVSRAKSVDSPDQGIQCILKHDLGPLDNELPRPLALVCCLVKSEK